MINLTLPLQSHFFQQKAFNPSLIQLICQSQKLQPSSLNVQAIHWKINKLDDQLTQMYMKIINLQQKNIGIHKKHINSRKSYTKQFYNLVNILIFNISAINQHYIKTITDELATSTAEDSVFNLSSSVAVNNNNHKYSINSSVNNNKQIVEQLKDNLRQYFYQFIGETKLVKEIIKNAQRKLQQNINDNQNQQLLTLALTLTLKDTQINLLQTLDYLCVKYHIKHQTSQRIIKILQHINHTNQSLIPTNNQPLTQTTTLLFSSSHQPQFYTFLQLSLSLPIPSITNLIISNYLPDPLRVKYSHRLIYVDNKSFSIFLTKLSKEYKNINYLIKKINNINLSNCLLQLWFFNVYQKWNQNIEEMINCDSYTSDKFINKLKDIQKFFRIFINIQNPQFHHLIQHCYIQLTHKFTSLTAFQLIKKLLLNRFLLSPSIYQQSNPLTPQPHLSSYITMANFIRTLFYPMKVAQLCEKNQMMQYSSISKQILSSLEYCLKNNVGDCYKSNDNEILLKLNMTSIYVNDKIIKGEIGKVYQDYKQYKEGGNYHQQYKNNQQYNNYRNQHNPISKHISSDYSLQFSLIKQQPSKNTLHHQQSLNYSNSLHIHPQNNNMNILLQMPTLQNVSEVQLKNNSNTNRNNQNIGENGHIYSYDNNSVRFMYQQLKGGKEQNGMGSTAEKQRLNRQSQDKDRRQNVTNQSNTHNKAQKSIQNNYSTTLKQMNLSSQTRLHLNHSLQPASILPTDRQILQQLVYLRKQYGQLRSNLNSSLIIRRQKSQKNCQNYNHSPKSLIHKKQKLKKIKESMRYI